MTKSEHVRIINTMMRYINRRDEIIYDAWKAGLDRDQLCGLTGLSLRTFDRIIADGNSAAGQATTVR